MIDDDDSAPGFFRYADKAVEAWADFVGGVDLTVPDIRGKRVKDQHPCARLSDSGEDTPIVKGQRAFLFADEQQAFSVPVRFDEAGDNGIVRIVLRGLIDDADRRRRLSRFRKWQRLAPCEQGGDCQHKGAFPVAGVALQQRDLAVWNERIPQLFDFFWLDFTRLDKLKTGIVCLICVLHFVLLFVLIDFLLIPFPAHRHRLLPLLPGHRKSPCFQYISGAIMGHMLRFRHL